MSWEVSLVSEVSEWLINLSEEDPKLADLVAAAIDMLEENGPTLGRPLVDTIKGSKIHNLKELRPSTVRLLFAFDPKQEAIILVAGDKAGQWKQWYADNIPVAEERYAQWINGYSVEE